MNLESTGFSWVVLSQSLSVVLGWACLGGFLFLGLGLGTLKPLGLEQ